MVLLQGSLDQRARIISGIVLFTFALTHFINHTTGLVSVEAMHTMQAWRVVFTRSYLGSAVLGAAIITHVVLGLARIATRSSLRLPWWETLQILLGLMIPFLLFPHIVNTRIASTFFGVNDIYAYELARLWPARALAQSLLLVLVWLHGCIGLHYWLRLWQPYRRAFPLLLGLAIAIPLGGIAGFVVSGQRVESAIADPQLLAELKRVVAWPSDANDARLAAIRGWVTWGIVLTLGALGAFVFSRRTVQQAMPLVKISYAGGPTISRPQGPTLLELSRMHGVAHTAVCGGRGRCSTCRVRIDHGQEAQLAPQFVEAVALGSIGAPPNVRLACQLRPRGELTVTRLLRPGTTGPSAAGLPESESDGVERILALMFLDVRNFTRMMENKLPYDVVFILNEFFAATGMAISEHGGSIDKFLGDGLLAVFGRNNGPEDGCRQALQAARAIDLALDHVNARLESELASPIEIGVGIHVGPLLLGRIGWGEAVDVTVIGHTVNAASRLEALTKEKNCQLVISRDVAQYAGLPFQESGEEIKVRGVAEPIEIVTIRRGRDLPPEILASSWKD
jgi:adenylate cyclase